MEKETIVARKVLGMIDSLTSTLTLCDEERKLLKQEYGIARQAYEKIATQYKTAINAKDKANIQILFEDMKNALSELQSKKEELLEHNAIYKSAINRLDSL